MKVHEFQAKKILGDAGVKVLRSIVCKTPDEVASAFGELGGSLAVVKAQIHAGGRGKGRTPGGQSGVELVKSADEANRVAANLLGQKLATIQTGPEGQTVRQVLVEAGCKISRELYLGIVLDRAQSQPVLMASSEGGMEIEEVAAKTPEKIFKAHFDPHFGLQSYQVRRLCQQLELSGQAAKSADRFMKALCRVFVEKDCSLVEINPLVVTEDGDLVALDAKMSFDSNGLFRHPEVAELRDREEEEPGRSACWGGGTQLREAGRQHRLPRQWCWTGHEHNGPHQASWWRTCQFLGRRRWRQRGAGHRGVSHHSRRRERERRIGKHLRWHYAMYDDRQRLD